MTNANGLGSSSTGGSGSSRGTSVVFYDEFAVSSKDFEELDLAQVPTLATYLDSWYANFTPWTTVSFVVSKTAHLVLFYTAWAGAGAYIAMTYPQFAASLEAGFILKVFTFMVGLLISLTLKEVLDRYKTCLAALIDFRDELRSFWYFAQLPLMDVPAARVILDVHIACYSVSLVRYLLHQAGEQLAGDVPDLVQTEFRNCVLFTGSMHDCLCSNPSYSEMLLVSWIRSMGIMTRELRIRLKWARVKLRRLLTARSVKSPRTSAHLLRTVVHMYLLAIPLLSASIPTRLSTPFIAMVLFPLLTLAEQMEDPFGLDLHDLPWPILLSTVMRCHLSDQSNKVLQDTIAFFNHGCTTGQWDNETAQRLFGRDTKTDTKGAGKISSHDNGKVDLSKYLVAPVLKCLDVVGNTEIGNMDILWANSVHRSSSRCGDEDEYSSGDESTW